MKTVDLNKEYSLKELAIINGSFTKETKYRYVGTSNSVYTNGKVYLCNGKGIYDNFKTLNNDSHCSNGGSEDDLFVKVIDSSSKIYWDGKGDLKIGMWVQTSTGPYKVLLPIDADGMVVVSDNGAYIIQDSSGCKPITPRTDKEKAIDTMLKLYPEASEFTKQVLSDAHDRWTK